MFKRRSVRVLSSAALLVLVLPVLNLVTLLSSKTDTCCTREALFNVDGPMGWVSAGFYRLGISIEPERTLIGRSNWLYLGDAYERSLTLTRLSGQLDDLAKGQALAQGAARWNDFLRAEGVRSFQIMMAPSKESIYPEFLPNWVSPPKPSVTDSILKGAGESVFHDFRKTLLAAKSTELLPLYFKTDTHWNMVGASHAFLAFAERMKAQAPELKWPEAASFRLSKVYKTQGGDLADFLRLASRGDDLPILEINRQTASFSHHEYGSNRSIDPAQAGDPRTLLTRPVETENPLALNRARVLWLSDSFGAHLADPMSATFSHVVRVHWKQAFADGGMFVQMVREWKPDFVFVTVTERSFRGDDFESFLRYAPRLAANASPNFEVRTPLAVKSLSGLVRSDDEGVFEVTSGAPSMVLEASADIGTSGVGAFLMELTCLDNSVSLPVQLFWKPAATPRFHRDQTLRFLHVGTRSKLPLPEGGPKQIQAVRVDLKTNGACGRFQWDGLAYVE